MVLFQTIMDMSVNLPISWRIGAGWVSGEIAMEGGKDTTHCCAAGSRSTGRTPAKPRTVYVKWAETGQRQQDADVEALEPRASV